MFDLPKWLFIAGVFLIACAGAAWLAIRFGFHGLPGDVVYRGRRFTVFFPIITCLALSLLGSVILWIINWWMHR